MLGKLINGRYHVIQILSAGEFSQTYLAQDNCRLGLPMCVVHHLFQLVSNEPQSLQATREWFIKAAETFKKLGKDDQIPQLVDYFEADQEFYLVREYIEGHPLSVEFSSNHRWSESQVVQMLQQVLSILEFVHDHGVIHQGIKPANVIRRQRDDRFVLIDFCSIKQPLLIVTAQQWLTRATYMSSLGYISTEQGRGRPRPSSDIYALGIVGIQALTGLHPTQLLEDSDTGEILWQSRARVSPELAHVLSKMVCYHFKNRYQSAAETLQALQPLVARYLFLHQEAPFGPPLVRLEPPFKLPRTKSKVPSQPSIATLQVPQALPSEDNNSVSAMNLSEPSLDSQVGNASAPIHNKASLLVGIGVGIATTLAMAIGLYYFLIAPILPSEVPDLPSYPTQR